MENENKIQVQLSKQHVAQLQKLPEQGMGYQLINVKLKDGRILKEKMVFNSTYLQLDIQDAVNADDIDTIQVATL
jgi:hypothetical protein